MKQYCFNEEQLQQFESLIRETSHGQEHKKDWVCISEDEVEAIFDQVQWDMGLDFERDRPVWCMAFAQLIDKKLEDKNL